MIADDPQVELPILNGSGEGAAAEPQAEPLRRPPVGHLLTPSQSSHAHHRAEMRRTGLDAGGWIPMVVLAFEFRSSLLHQGTGGRRPEGAGSSVDVTVVDGG
jgi:hypothetical protein